MKTKIIEGIRSVFELWPELLSNELPLLQNVLQIILSALSQFDQAVSRTACELWSDIIKAAFVDVQFEEPQSNLIKQSITFILPVLI